MFVPFRFREMNAFISENRLRPVLDKVFEFDQAKKAYGYLGSRGASGDKLGKVVIRVTEDGAVVARAETKRCINNHGFELARNHLCQICALCCPGRVSEPAERERGRLDAHFCAHDAQPVCF